MPRTAVRSIALATCVLLAIAGCSKKVDSDSVEKQVVTKVEQAFPEATSVKANCPSDIEAKKGKSFNCTVTLNGQQTDIKVGITNVKDKNFTFALKPTQAIVPTAKLAEILQKQAGANTHVSCGSEAVVLKDPGETVDCTVTGNGQTRTVKVRFKDSAGNYEVLP